MRAEIIPQNSSPIRRHEGRHGTAFQRFKVDVLVIADGFLQWLPRPSWKVAPAIGIGLATPAGMAILENFSGRTALVQAAGCENPIVALNFMYAQDVRKNPDSLTITNESFVITMDLPATFGPAEVLYKKNPDDPKETPKSYPLQLEMRRDHASGKTVVKEQPNKGNSLYLEYTFLDDAKDPKTGFTPRRPLVLTCNEAGYFVGGRASTPDTLNRVVNNPSITGLSKVGDRSFELVSAFMKVYKRRPAFTPPGAKPDENLKALKASVAEAIASYKRIKAEEAKRFGVDAAQKVAVTGVVTATTTSRVTTPTVAAAVTLPAASPTATRTPETPTATAEARTDATVQARVTVAAIDTGTGRGTERNQEGSSSQSRDWLSWLALGGLLGVGAAFLWKWNRKIGGIPPSYSGAASGLGTTTGAIGGGPNPNTAPNVGPTQQKNPEWITGQQEFEKRWQAAKSKLSTIRPGDTGNEPEYILDRFKAATGIIQEVSLGSAIGISTLAMRVRAGLEYLIPQIWPDNRVLKRFFDPNFNAGYLLYAESLARIVYLPENYRNLSSFTPDQKRDIRRIRRILIYALHPDTAKVDADKNLQESVDDLLKRFNPAWSYIENLIK